MVMREGEFVPEPEIAVPTAQPFAEIFATYHAGILRYLGALLRDPSLAEDIAQETFVKAYQALPRTAPTNLKAWLYAIATNAAFSALRRRRILAFLSFGTLATHDAEIEPTDPWRRVEERELLIRALQRLSKRDAACLLLHFQQGLSYAELATVLGVSVPAAKMRLSRARAAFRDRYVSLSEEANW
jgi:RNA polymerase sigma factor (sigma-70 family)